MLICLPRGAAFEQPVMIVAHGVGVTRCWAIGAGSYLSRAVSPNHALNAREWGSATLMRSARLDRCGET
jgi:hypothetical protein